MDSQTTAWLLPESAVCCEIGRPSSCTCLEDANAWTRNPATAIGGPLDYSRFALSAKARGAPSIHSRDETLIGQPSDYRNSLGLYSTSWVLDDTIVNGGFFGPLDNLDTPATAGALGLQPTSSLGLLGSSLARGLPQSGPSSLDLASSNNFIGAG